MYGIEHTRVTRERLLGYLLALVCKVVSERHCIGKSVSECYFREFRLFSAIAVNHCLYIVMLCLGLNPLSLVFLICYQEGEFMRCYQ